MDSVKGVIKYILKAYFAGCLGCLGSLSVLVVLGLVISLTLGPSVVSILQGIQLPAIPNLPGMLPQGTGIPPAETPGQSQLPATGCENSMEGWVSKTEFGSPVNTFSSTDGIFPVVSNLTDCGAVNVRFLDPSDEIILEKSFNVKGGGSNGYGDYNIGKNLPPGTYKMEFWYGENLLKTIQLTIQ